MQFHNSLHHLPLLIKGQLTATSTYLSNRTLSSSSHKSRNLGSSPQTYMGWAPSLSATSLTGLLLLSSAFFITPSNSLSTSRAPPLALHPSTNYINADVASRYSKAFLPPLPRPSGVPSDSPPPSDVVQIPEFLSLDECKALIDLGEEAARTGAECEEYLNARVNEEVSSTGASSEASDLIDSHLSSSDLPTAGTIDDTAGGGYRVRLKEDDVKRHLEERVKFVMGLEEREEGFFFEEGAWERPTPRRIVIRDQTVVKYQEKVREVSRSEVRVEG